MPKAKRISISDGFESLTFLKNRTPQSTGIEDSFCTLSEYRDGGIFLAHYAGNSEWERHSKGDELVMVIEGSTTLILLLEGSEVPNTLSRGEILVVPKNTWHRFESPNGVKIMTVTPQPTDHSIENPE